MKSLVRRMYLSVAYHWAWHFPNRRIPVLHRAIRPIYRWAFGLAFLILLCGITASAQSECPQDKVCISREAAIKALADADRVKADEIAITGYKQAIDDLKAEVNKMRVEFAAVSGENTALKQNAVSDRAIIDILIKNARPKKIGLINLF